jgi:replicative DNA helicase
MSYFDDFLHDVDRGRLGLNRSLSTGLPKLDQYIGGVQKQVYYLVGGNTGTGKTAFADAAFVLNPYIHMRHLLLNPVEGITPMSYRVFYYSFEISARKKIAKWVCYLIFIEYGLVIDIKEVY